MKLYYFSLYTNIATQTEADANPKARFCVIPEEISPILTQDMIRDWERQLLAESAHLTEYMMRAMNREFSFDCHRINLLCVSGEPRATVRKDGSLHEMDIPFDAKYFTYPPQQRQAYLYEVLVEGIRLLCMRKEWDFSLFEKHLIALRDGGFYVEHDFDGKKCKNGKLTAKLIGVQTLTETSVYVDFYQGRKHLQRTFLRTAPQETTRSSIYVHHMKWVDDKTVVITDYWDKEPYYATLEV